MKIRNVPVMVFMYMVDNLGFSIPPLLSVNFAHTYFDLSNCDLFCSQIMVAKDEAKATGDWFQTGDWFSYVCAREILPTTTTTTTRRSATLRAAALMTEGASAVSHKLLFLPFSDSEVETCRWDVKNILTFKFSVKSHASHLYRSCCLSVTALVVSSLFMWLKQEAKQWQSHCCVPLLKSDFITTYLCSQKWRQKLH